MTQSIDVAALAPGQPLILEAATKGNGWLTRWVFLATKDKGILQVSESAPDYHESVYSLPVNSLVSVARVLDSAGHASGSVVTRGSLLVLNVPKRGVSDIVIKVKSVTLGTKLVVDRQLTASFYARPLSPLHRYISGVLNWQRGQFRYGGYVWMRDCSIEDEPPRIRTMCLGAPEELLSQVDPGLSLQIEEVVLTDTTVLGSLKPGKYAGSLCTGLVYPTTEHWAPLHLRRPITLVNVHGPSLPTALGFRLDMLAGRASWAAT